MEIKQDKIAVVIVTYNRKKILQDCLGKVLNQSIKLDTVFLIDNASTDGTEEMLREKYLNNHIFRYLKLKENLGGAGGFYTGIKIAYKEGFQWLWLMDDDVFPEKDALEKLLVSYKKLENKGVDIGMLGSTPIDLTDKSKLSWVLRSNRGKIYQSLSDIKDKITEVISLPFNSVIIKRDVIEKIGFPEKDFFLWLDDVEYCYRINSQGMKIFLDKESIILHPPKRGKEFSLLGKKVFLKSFTDPPWRDYYQTRNTIFLIKKYNLGIAKVIKLIAMILLSLLIRSKKLKRTKFYIKGIIDGIRNRAGKVVLPS